MTKHAGTEASKPKITLPATAVISGAFLSGAMMSFSAFVIPVFLDTNQSTEHMVRQWARLYHYGHIYLPALCVSTTGMYAFTTLQKRAANNEQWSRYALAAISTIAMVPFTWVFMTPTNNTLFSLGASEFFMELGLTRGLLVKWAWLHVSRSFFPLVGAILGFTALQQELRSR